MGASRDPHLVLDGPSYNVLEASTQNFGVFSFYHGVVGASLEAGSPNGFV